MRSSTCRVSVRWSGPRWLWVALVGAGVVGSPSALLAQHVVVNSFESNVEGWKIPEWAKSSDDYVAEECRVSTEHADDGQAALEIRTAFPGHRWTGAYVERDVEMTDWTIFSTLKMDVYVPATAPAGLGGKIILTVGDGGQWVEMNRTIALKPGTWTTLQANLRPGSMDWKFFPNEAFRKNIHKMGVRIESNREPIYWGGVFLDNVRLEE